MSSSLVGQKLGKYQITQLVGHGGMATVYKGYQADVARYVAVKVLPPHPGQAPGFVDRFRQEARTIAKLQHPHILPLYDYGDQDSVLYLVMPYIDGGSLSDRLRRGRLSLNDVERLVNQIASALDYAHRQGVIHRDIKPDNILIDKEGFALLSDFGIAKLMESGGMTTTGGLVGTPTYIAPEQAQNAAVDGRVDIYSFGVVTYEMLTGAPPYQSDTPVQLIIKHMTEKPPLLSSKAPGLPPGLDRVIEKALSKEAADRYQTAAAFAEDFRRAIQGQDLMQPEHPTLIEPHPTRPYTPPTPVPQSTPYPPANFPPGYQVGTPPPGYQMGTPPPGYYIPTNTPMPTQVGTQNGLNSVVTIGGFAVIATLLVVVLIVLLSQSNNPPRTTPETFDPNRPPEIAAQITPLVEPPPTEEATAAPTSTDAPPPREAAGRVSYSTAAFPGDTITVTIDQLPALPNREQYAAWMIDTMDGEVLPLGVLEIGEGGRGSVTMTGQGSLATHYHRVFITREGDPLPEMPVGDIVFEGELPVDVVAALNEIFMSSPDGLPAAASSGGGEPGGEEYEDETTLNAGTSLLEGARVEAALAQRHAGLAAGATNVSGMHTHAEHTINILLGTQDDLDGSGDGQNPGRGVGVVTFLDRIDAKISDASASAPLEIQRQLESIRVCVANTRAWMDEVITLERELLASDSLEAVAEQMRTSTERTLAIMDGVDLNQNGDIEDFEGECGLYQLYFTGISAADFALYAPEE